MRDKVKLVAVALMLVSTPTMAGVVFTDDFNGGFDQSWQWVTDGDARAAIADGALRMYSPTGYNASCIGGYVAATYGVDGYVSALVNCSGASTGNDQGVYTRLQGANQFYGLNYDPFLNKLQLVYSQGSSFTNLAGLNLSDGAFGTDGQTVDLRLQVQNYGDVVRLVGQAWDSTGTVLLGSVQEVVDGSTVIEGIMVPVLGAGVSGVYAALNFNEYQVTGGLSPLNAKIDNFAATGDCSEGDANLDGVVDEKDYGIVTANWGSGDSWSEGDFNFDGTVNQDDLSIIVANWDGAGAAPTSIPEPTTLGLLGIGAVAFARRRK